MTKEEKRNKLVKEKLEEIKKELAEKGDEFDASASHTYFTPEIYAEIDRKLSEEG